ncbi:FG-GAP repeat domain-containing protein [Streptomyces sp. NPDC052236]|uniref:FG-GAP repeat domain-containing protein n=1 Tax=Streptomyces sp. NPDC052236 TaxID=3365686 RepID=UPI0037CD7DC2
MALLATGLVGAGGAAAASAPAAAGAEGDDNTVSLSTPGLAAGGKVTHTVTVHAVEKGALTVRFQTSLEQRSWYEEDRWTNGLSIKAADGTSPVCVLPDDVVEEAVTCAIPAGDTTISYSMNAAVGTPAWKINTMASYTVGSAVAATASSEFAVQSTIPVAMDYLVFGRQADGKLFGSSAYGVHGLDPEWGGIASGEWGDYSAFTKLSPITVRGKGGDIVARDKSGHLWYIELVAGAYTRFKEPVEVGSGWGEYTSLRGAGDLTGDGRPDLIARDGSGVLWLYRATGNANNRFEQRVRIGTGWNIYASLTGSIDVTGDGKADLIGKDAAGDLWLYQGTGSGTTPFGARTKIGNSWNIYNSLVPLGDINADGHADLVARDSAGVMWLYPGTGDATLPFKARVHVHRYWEQFDALM